MQTTQATVALNAALLCLPWLAHAAHEPGAPTAIPVAQDTRYPGMLVLDVDLRERGRH